MALVVAFASDALACVVGQIAVIAWVFVATVIITVAVFSRLPWRRS